MFSLPSKYHKRMGLVYTNSVKYYLQQNTKKFTLKTNSTFTLFLYKYILECLPNIKILTERIFMIFIYEYGHLCFLLYKKTTLHLYYCCCQQYINRSVRDLKNPHTNMYTKTIIGKRWDVDAVFVLLILLLSVLYRPKLSLERKIIHSLWIEKKQFPTKG